MLHWYLAWRDNQWPVFEELFLRDKHASICLQCAAQAATIFSTNWSATVLLSTRRKSQELSTADYRSTVVFSQLAARPHDPGRACACSTPSISRFASSSGLFARLIDEARPAITFQLLDLENFGLSDDLYIKMNAWGKPLTAFETFKARYEQELKSQLAGITFDLGGHPFGAAEYVARRMDTAWTDLFWKHQRPTKATCMTTH